MIKNNKIYIHIGYPRAGSTFLQKNFFLKNNELFFIARKLNYGTQDILFYDFLEQILTYSQSDFIKKKSLILNKLKKTKFSNKKINLISEEGLTSQYYWKNKDIYTTLERLISTFRELGIECKFIVILRNQAECIESVYKYFYSSFFRKKFLTLEDFLNNDNQISKSIFNSFDYFYLYKFFKKKRVSTLFLPLEILSSNEKKFISELSAFLKLKKKIQINKKEIVNSHSNLLFKYRFSIKNLKYILFNLLNIFFDWKVSRFLRFSSFQKKFIMKKFIKQNKELAKFIDLDQKYLKL